MNGRQQLETKLLELKKSTTQALPELNAAISKNHMTSETSKIKHLSHASSKQTRITSLWTLTLPMLHNLRSLHSRNAHNWRKKAGALGAASKDTWLGIVPKISITTVPLPRPLEQTRPQLLRFAKRGPTWTRILWMQP
jgi:hypothetical protein